MSSGIDPMDSGEPKAAAADEFSSLTIHENWKKESARGSPPEVLCVLLEASAELQSAELKAKAAELSYLPIPENWKKKSVRGSSSKDLDELKAATTDLKAKATQLSSLPIHTNRKKKSTWGCSPEDSDELKAKAAAFSYLPIHEKLVCLTAASFTSLAYHRQLRYSRKKKRELQHYDKWTSYLYKDELEMIGELDGKEAEKIYNKSQEEPYQCSCFEIRLDEKKLEEMMWMSDLTLLDDEVKSASSFNEEFFADREIKSDKKEKVESFILEDKLRTKMLEGRESYLKKMEGAMHKRTGKKSKFNQSDDKKRKEMLHKKKMMMARITEERLPEFVW